MPFVQMFLKTGPGEYGEGDVSVGVKVPAIRAVVREGRDTPLDGIRDQRNEATSGGRSDGRSMNVSSPRKSAGLKRKPKP